MVGQAFVELLETLRSQISVRRICELMGVARATYYRWRKRFKKSCKNIIGHVV